MTFRIRRFLVLVMFLQLGLSAWVQTVNAQSPPKRPPQGAKGTGKQKLPVGPSQRESDFFWSEAVKSERNHKYIEAAEWGIKRLNSQKSVPGIDPQKISNLLNWIADVEVKSGNLPAAIGHTKERLDICKQIHGADNYRTVSVELELQLVQKLQGLSPEARLEVQQTFEKLEEFGQFLEERKYEEGLALARQLVETQTRLIGVDQTKILECLFWVARFQTEQHDYSSALQTRQQNLEYYERLYGAAHPQYADALSDVGRTQGYLNQLTEAEETLLKSLQIIEASAGTESIFYGFALGDLAEIYNRMEDPERATKLYRQTADIQQKSAGGISSAYAFALTRLRIHLTESGFYAEAEQVCQQELEINRQLHGDQSQEYAKSLFQLGTCCLHLRDHKQAEEALQKCLQIQRAKPSKESLDLGMTLDGLGEVSRQQGDFSTAQDYFKQASAALEGWGALLECMRHRAQLSIDLKDYDLANDFLEFILKAEQERYGEDDPWYIKDLRAIGALALLRKDSERAMQHYRKAFDIATKVLGDHDNQTIDLAFDIAEVSIRTKQYEQAEERYKQCLSIREKYNGEQHPAYASAVFHLASFYDRVGRLEEAEPHYQQAVAILTAYLDQASLYLTESRQLQIAQENTHYLDAYLSAEIRLKRDPRSAYDALLSWKGRTLARQQAARYVSEQEELRPIYAELQDVTGKYLGMSRLQKSPLATPRDRSRFSELSAKKQALEADLNRKSAAYQTATLDVTADDVKQALPKNAALVDFHEFWLREPSATATKNILQRRHLIAFVMRKNSPVQLFDLGDAAPIHQAIQVWRDSMGTGLGGTLGTTAIQQIVWSPLVKSLGDASLLLLSPDGVVGTFPFAALPGKYPGSFLIEDYQIVSVPVPRLIPLIAARSAEKSQHKKILLMGGINFQKDEVLSELEKKRKPGSKPLNSSSSIWKPLPGAQIEVRSIRDVYKNSPRSAIFNVNYITGIAATEAAFRTNAGQSDVIHVATHGFFFPREEDIVQDSLLFPVPGAASTGLKSEQLSGIVFAGANRPPSPQMTGPDQRDDGYLTSEEIRFLPLKDVKLVVLSGCDTAMGKAAGAEGLLGLQRSFQIAGARTTVASLWPIPDLASGKVMEQFYRNYVGRDGQPPRSTAEALREAQLWAIRNPKLLLADRDGRTKIPDDLVITPPYLWAAFVISGDWN